MDEPGLAALLNLQLPSSPHGPAWVASKYESVFDALTDAVRDIGEPRLALPFPERRMSLGAHALHIVSFAEGGWLAHRTGAFTLDDMLDATRRCEPMTKLEEIVEYAERVRDEIASFLRGASSDDLAVVVSSVYGGEVAVIEVVRIMLRHSAHHLRQLEWFMRTELGVDHEARVAAAVSGITVPGELFAM